MNSFSFTHRKSHNNSSSKSSHVEVPTPIAQNLDRTRYVVWIVLWIPWAGETVKISHAVSRSGLSSMDSPPLRLHVPHKGIRPAIVDESLLLRCPKLCEGRRVPSETLHSLAEDQRSPFEAQRCPAAPLAAWCLCTRLKRCPRLPKKLLRERPTCCATLTTMTHEPSDFEQADV